MSTVTRHQPYRPAGTQSLLWFGLCVGYEIDATKLSSRQQAQLVISRAAQFDLSVATSEDDSRPDPAILSRFANALSTRITDNSSHRNRDEPSQSVPAIVSEVAALHGISIRSTCEHLIASAELESSNSEANQHPRLDLRPSTRR